jgi:hypothetical protein
LTLDACGYDGDRWAVQRFCGGASAVSVILSLQFLCGWSCSWFLLDEKMMMMVRTDVGIVWGQLQSYPPSFIRPSKMCRHVLVCSFSVEDEKFSSLLQILNSYYFLFVVETE